MGLFSFLKNAGTSILGGGNKKETKASAAPVADTDTALEKLENAQIALRLTNQVTGLGLKVENLNIEVDDDVATIYGTVPSHEEREKVILVVGNTQGVASVDDRLTVNYVAENEAAAPAAESTFYEVKSGDSLSKIAKAHYGNANKYNVIFEANKPMLKDPDKIYPGQVLRIPPMA